MTRVTQSFPPRGNLVSTNFVDERFDAGDEYAIKLESGAFRTSWLSSHSCGAVMIPRGGRLILEYVEGEQ
jgi:hypothetical protein